MTHRSLVVLTALLLGVALDPGGAAAQPIKPAATAAPKPSSAVAPSASAAASAAPSAPGAPPGAGQDALPPGHPPLPGSGDGLPPGHPSVAGDTEDVHGASPAARGAHGDRKVFRPLEDTVVDDPSLPPGTVVVSVKDAQDKVVPRAPITLGVLHNSVAKGESNERFARDGDQEGAARFEHLAVGTGHSYRVSTARGPAQYVAPPFGLSERAGKRVTLHAYEVGSSLDDLEVYLKGEVDIGLREDSIVVEQTIGVLNMGAVAWVANAPIELPRGFKAFNKEDAMDDARVEEVAGSGAAIRGTFPPGQRALHFRYQVPLDNNAKQSLQIHLPRHLVQVQVVAAAGRSMSLDVDGFPNAERVEGRDGKRYLLAAQQISEARPDLSTLDITLSGLPTSGLGRWVAALLAALALGAGILHFTQTGAGTLDGDARDEWLEAREALLREIVALERAHKDGTVGPKTYARVRAALLDALARIVAIIEPAEPGKKRKTEAAR